MKKYIYNITTMNILAKKNGGRCLARVYAGVKSKLQWECKEGHRWEAVPDHIRRGSWCPTCVRKKKLTIEEMNSLAKKQEGKCLSNKYINSKTKLLWECSKKHQWEARPEQIKRGHWCQSCAGTRKYTIQGMNSLAEQKRGKCLSKSYINANTNLLWSCAENHHWRARPSSIIQGSWCPVCDGQSKLSLDEMTLLANKKGGRCLSKTYVNSKTKLLWECPKKHRWEAQPSHIKSGTWCPYCNQNAPLNITDISSIAKSRGGVLLSTYYKNSQTKMLWQCREGHEWEATTNKIKRGSWCPMCSDGLGERMCRVLLEELFNHKFPKIRPKWLINSDGNRMELDGLCISLGLAFEHQGEQHYSTKTHFIKTKKKLNKRRKDDAWKKDLCRANGIKLIEFKEVPRLLPIQTLKSHLKKECLKLKIPIPENLEEKKINFNKAYVTYGAKEVLKNLGRLARSRGGELISEQYINSLSKLDWKCNEGHKWEANSNKPRFMTS